MILPWFCNSIFEDLIILVMSTNPATLFSCVKWFQKFYSHLSFLSSKESLLVKCTVIIPGIRSFNRNVFLTTETRVRNSLLKWRAWEKKKNLTNDKILHDTTQRKGTDLPNWKWIKNTNDVFFLVTLFPLCYGPVPFVALALVFEVLILFGSLFFFMYTVEHVLS